MTHPDFIEALLDPAAYPAAERPDRVELAETHISWLFFTGQFVYKVKKPVDFGYLDFSTLEQRHIYCHEEFRLNRRISPSVYVGVSEIREQGGAFVIGGPGRIVDYAVKMRQLPRDRWLRHLLKIGKVDAPLIERVARRVADFHATAESDEMTTRIGGIDTVRFNAVENFDQTRKYVGTTVSRPQYDAVRAYTEAFLDIRHVLFAERASTERIRDCHGDLHADQICIENGIDFIDCIEFNYRFSHSDVAADVAFLAMDLDHLGRPDLTRAYVDAYVTRSGDRRLVDILDFYKCYRAYTRGKVTSLRLDNQNLSDVERTETESLSRSYFELAHEYAKPTVPVLLITRGLMGSGKTALAQGLAPRLGAHVFSSDTLRKRMAGPQPDEQRSDAWGEGIYSPEFTRRTYEEMHHRAADLLSGGHSVVLDASYREWGWRDAARRVARDTGARFLIIEAESPHRIVEQRLAARHLPAEATVGEAAAAAPSNGRATLLQSQIAAFEAEKSHVEQDRMTVDTSGPIAETTRAALKRIYEWYLQPFPRAA